MLGFWITIKNNDGKILVNHTEYPNDRISIFEDLQNMEKEGKAKCIEADYFYPNKYSVKACDIIPLLEKLEKWRDTLPEWDPRSKGTVLTMDHGTTSDLPVETTKNKSKIPISSLDETLMIEVWDLS
jgi:hypothetical protein